MRFCAITILAAIALAAHVAPSFADEVYYLEIGDNMQEQDAQKEWQNLSAKYKGLLGGLTYYPKKVLAGGTHVTTRIQAGPIEERAQAEKICSRLFSRNTPCFVINGASGPPPSMVISLSETSEEGQGAAMLPWLSAAPAMNRVENVAVPVEPASVPAPAPVAVAANETASEVTVDANTNKHEVVLPWLAEKNQPVNPNAQARVEVAEAVRVPLSEAPVLAANAPVSVSSLPDLPESRVNPAGLQDSTRIAAGWLNVAAFPDEELALAFWQGIRISVPDEASKLRVRIMKALLTAERQDISLNIGPFADRSAADAFCQNGVHSINPNLRCSFGTADSNPRAIAPAERSQHADAYEARRRAIASRREPGAMQAQALSVPRPVNKSYWVQVISADSQMDALRQWETIRSGNDDLLKGKRGTVSSGMTNSNFVVRVGPIGGEGEAMNLCGSLKQRNIECRILSSM